MALDVRFENCTVVTSEGRTGPGAAVGVRDGRIAAVGDPAAMASADQVVDCEGNVLVPGVVDAHIHARDPGDTHKEDWETATRAAAAGGVTTVAAMPNTDPIVDRPGVLGEVFDRADDVAHVDFQQYAVLTGANTDRVRALAEAGAVGFKVFLGTTVGGIEPPDDGDLHEAMGDVAETGLRVGVHEENDEVVAHYTAAAREAGRNRPIDHARSRPVVAETEAVERTTLFAADAGCPVHMVHVTSGSAAAAAARAKARGVDVTAETCPHYLWFTEDVLTEVGNVARVNPPLRDEGEREGLWTELRAGAIDCVTTDHAPHTDAEKGVDDPFGNTWASVSGFVGLETEVPAMLTFVDEGRLSLERWVRLHSTRPAQIWGMYPRKGSLRVGTDADFTVVDPERVWTLDRADLHSKSTVTPFDGEQFVGGVEATVVRGEVVYDRDVGVVGEAGHGERVAVGPTESGRVDAD
ncbi:MAG: allantoinase AllB [Halobacteriaceae archaeon]